MKTKTIVLLAVLLAGSDQVAPAADNLSAALQQGLLEEEANHNLEAAIQAYQSVVDQFGDQRKIAATALFRLGECYRKQGKTNEAVLQYQRVLADFADQASLIGPSEKNLAVLGQASDQGEGRSIAVTDKVDEETKAIERYKTLAENSPDLLNAKDQGGSTPLHNAAGRGEMAVAKFLLANGADINSRARQGFTPLHNAARFDQKGMIELLLAHHAEVNSKSPEGVTPLHLAAAKGFLSLTETLLANGADPNAEMSGTAIEPFHIDREYAGAQDPAYFAATPLHYAAASGHLAIVKMLLDHKADVNAKSQGGQTPLFMAVERDRLEVAKLLLANRANPNVKASTDITVFGMAIYTAISNRNIELIRLLLEAGADVNARGIILQDNSVGGMRSVLVAPLAYTACQGVQIESVKAIVEFLLQNKADVNVQDDLAKSPLHWAVENGNTKTVKLLLDHAADPNLKNQDDDTPLHLSKSKEIAELLLAKNADVKARNKSGRTPLHHAASRQGAKALVELLLSKGAEANAADNLGQTPLFRAVFVRDKENTELLIAHGADVNTKDNQGKTPLLDLLTSLKTIPGQVPGIVPGVYAPGLRPPEVARQTATADEIAGLLRKHGAKE